MAKFTSFLSVIIIVLFLKRIQHTDSKSANTSWNEQVELDPSYTIVIELNSTGFIITANVATSGYVGFGISKDGRMHGADIFIAGVKNDGNRYSADYHGNEHTPELDASHQNWHLISAEEDDSATTIQFYRDYRTDDLDHDIEVMPGETQVIWSIGSADDTTKPHKTRGSKKVTLRESDLQGRSANIEKGGNGNNNGSSIQYKQQQFSYYLSAILSLIGIYMFSNHF